MKLIESVFPKDIETAFWYTKNGKLIKLGKEEEHLDFALKNPNLLGVTEEEIEENRFDEINILEFGDDCVDFLEFLLKKGNLRIRFFSTDKVEDGTFCNICYYKNKNIPMNFLLDYEDELGSWPIYLWDITKDSAGEDFNSAKDAIKDYYKFGETKVMDYKNIYREGKIKEFGPTYYWNLMTKYNEKLCDAKNDLEEAFFQYIHDAFWHASESIKSAQHRFYLRQLVTEPSSIEYYHGEDFEEENAYDFREFIKDPVKNESILKEYLDKEDIPAWENLKNLFSNDKSYERFNKKYKKEKEDSEVKRAESEAKFKQETKPLDDAIKSIGLEIFYFEYFENINEFAFVINTEDEYEAENARDEVAKVLNGAADNAYGASYDDIQGMGDVHLGCVQLYEFSEMNGGDKYEDLDEDYRDKYVIFACPKQKWISYRQQTDW